MFLMMLYLLCFDGDVSIEFITGADFYKPIAIEVGPNNRIYVADAKEHHVRVFDKEGNALTTIGRPGQGPGEFNGPSDIAFLADGRFLVADSGQSRLHLYSAAGEFQRMIVIKEQNVASVLVLPDGNLLISRTGGYGYRIDMEKKPGGRFGIFDLNGNKTGTLGAAEVSDNPLLAMVMERGDYDLVGKRVVQASLVQSQLLFFDGGTNKSVLYRPRFEAREPKSEMKEVKNSDGTVSYSMGVTLDRVCAAMTAIGPEDVLILRYLDQEAETNELVRLGLDGKDRQVWPQRFQGTALAASPDGAFVYMINETEDDQVITRVSLKK